MMGMLQEPPVPEKRARLRLLRGVIIAAAVGVLILALLGSPMVSAFLWPMGFVAGSSQDPTPTHPPTKPPAPTATATMEPASGTSTPDGLVILSVSEFGYAHLFSYDPSSAPFTRLTTGDWDDIHPSISPDSSKVAFASNRGGQWDLYVLDLQTGATLQVSNDVAYDASPSWSSDSGWLAYEHYEGSNLEIYIRPIDGSVDPVAISAHPGLDYAPAWRPGTQQIAFVSDRGGSQQLWLVDLARSDSGRFSQILSQNVAQRSPAWSPSGDHLAWSQLDGEFWNLYAADLERGGSPQLIGVGQEPAWNPAGDTLLASFRNSQHTYLAAYTLEGALVIPPEKLTRYEGAAWGSAALADPLPGQLLTASQESDPPEWAASFTESVPRAAELDTIALADVNVPFAQLNEAVVEPFSALRQRSAQLLGWDALSTLENAYVPVGEPLPPLRQQDWLYTGRAFALHSNLLDAGWLVAVRETSDGQTYWRVFLRTADGSGYGRPLTRFPWNFAARYSGGEIAFQNGGESAEEIPPGNWIDFTALAADYGFERVPALPNWRNFFPSIMFNEFVLRAGLTWEDAMLQLHSPIEVATAAASSSE